MRIYNTKTRAVEEFKPIQEKRVGIYSCGPTVYHTQHLGNMRAAVFADTLHRTFTANGYTVRHIINITDVGHNTDDGDDGEDKMEKGSRREGKTVWEIAKMYTEKYFRDLQSLNVDLQNYTFPRATDNIPEQITLIQKLENKGYTYKITDGIYFDTSKYSAYADFARLDVKGLQSGARVEENHEKKNVTDFALWKFSNKKEKRQMEWDSPWGVGFPGWHIECSAMSTKYLGNHFDIHTGGIEHIPVHHTNEIAQSECANDETYVNYWMHNNHLQDTLGKMSKSNDDFLTVESLITKGYNPIVFRYFLLTAHYRKELAFSYEALDGVKTAYKKLQDFVLRNKEKEGQLIKAYLDDFMNALNDDLNTPNAIATMWKMIRDETDEPSVAQTIRAMSIVLGLNLENAEEKKIHISEEVKELLKKRSVARKEKNFALSDTLRNEIRKLGFIVKDSGDNQELVRI